ncbi:SGNH/GDSL hydrolase family protein [Sphingomonas sp. BGYR3]|uniref:SGNH/GDSL hydrolase family protein n=1 Tax=Sphingomonas sp. BGYR3 TaxID=2975483 RepID=UPI0021A5FF83|nr:SGNH/GDSL hydrolase family protein [Sphingomonas sp. BGYR3]MDG5489275.1 SGNH/GDSL hydrolase family protein [Sphingomonas sp. BGYR3]
MGRYGAWRTGHTGMKLALAAVAAGLAGCGGGSGGGSASAPTPTPTVTPTPTTSALPYTASIRVAFIGASITAGTSDTSRVWANQTATWLRSQYSSATSQNFSLPYTTSQFAAYRMEEDLRGFVPDLVFVEFAVNDLLLDENGRVRYTDALIAKLRRANPRVIIVYVAATNALDGSSRLANTVPAHIRQLRDVATRNQVHFIDAGAVMWDRVRSGGGSILSYLPDGIHPNDAGSDIYFAAVRDSLISYLPTAAVGPATTSYIAQTRLDGAAILPATRAAATGCSITNQTAANSYWRFAQSLTCQGGNQFTLDFTGTSVGFVYGAGRDTGALSCSIDGGPAQTITLFDPEFPASGLFLYANLLTGFSDGAHRVSCSVSNTRPTVNGVTSTGTSVVISGFMTSSERPIP